MEKIKTIKDLLETANKKNTLILYGAGVVGKTVGEFLKNRNIIVSAYAITKLSDKKERDGIPIYSLEYVLRSFELRNINFIITATGVNRLLIKKELDDRKIDSYFELPESLIYKIVQENRRENARKAERNKGEKSEKTIGFLKPGYLDSDYAEHRLIIDIIKGISYVELPKETADFLPMSPYYEENVEKYKSLVEACYCPNEYVPEVDLIHTFNVVCNTDIPWCASFETIIPRVWQETEEEKKYFLQLVEYLKCSNCKALYALSQNAYNIQMDNIMSVLSLADAKLIMEKTRVLHPPQKVLITKAEFIKKHTVAKIHFIFIGRLFFIKGGREIIQALSKFEGKYDFKLTLISSFLYDDYFTNTSYEELVRCKDLVKSKAWIDYYESLPNDMVLEKCKEATVGLLPSVDETYGYVVLEMQASGCPVVTTNIRAFPENNNQECGWICRLPSDKLGRCSERETKVWSTILQRELERCFQEIFDHPEKIKTKGMAALNQIRKKHDPEQYQRELRRNFPSS